MCGTRGPSPPRRSRRSIDGSGTVQLGHEVTPQGNVRTLTYLPRIGVSLKVPSSYDRFAWYGRKLESYNDRRESSPIGVYSSTVKDQYTPYYRPQDHGNHTDARWALLTDGRTGGLLVAGVAVGPYGLRLVGNEERVHVLAEVGVIVLLFSVGLEFSLSRLMAMGRLMLQIGLPQVLFSTVATLLATWWYFGVWNQALFAGMLMAMSSRVPNSSMAVPSRRLHRLPVLRARSAPHPLDAVLHEPGPFDV